LVCEPAMQHAADLRRGVRPPAFLRQTDSALARIWKWGRV